MRTEPQKSIQFTAGTAGVALKPVVTIVMPAATPCQHTGRQVRRNEGRPPPLGLPHGVRSQKAVTKKGVSVKISGLAEAKMPQMISNREGARHGSASGVGRANGPEQAEGKRKASKARRPAGTLTSRRGRPNRAFIGRARTRMARTSDDRPGELRRRGTRGSRANAAAGRSLCRRAVGQGQ